MQSPAIESPLPRRAFVVGWSFLVVATALGFLLRLQVLHPLVPLEYAHLLHAHSHVAFLGWVYNAFFALALRLLLPPAESDRLVWLFIVAQIATLGMLLTFPFQGYARESIAFSTLHLGAAGVFAWRLLRRNHASSAARAALLWAIAFMLLSGLGPLALGPLSALQLKGSPWYSFAIYFYLHFQYNGWFLFFLLALATQRAHDTGGPVNAAHIRAGTHLAAAGCILTLALSALWMSPPRWVHQIALAGAVAQLAGVLLIARGLPHRRLLTDRTAIRLSTIGLAALLAKFLLQLLGSWPALTVVATQRPVIIAFLHLIFLGGVTPLLLAWAVEFGWHRIRGVATAGLVLLLLGIAGSELALFAFPLPAYFPGMGDTFSHPAVLASLAGLMLAGVSLLAAGLQPGRKRSDE